MVSLAQENHSYENLLTQANRNHLAVSVIVNDMSDLDVDGVLIANTEIVNIANNNFVSITSDSISSQSGIKTVDKAIKICSGIICLTLYLSKHPEVATHCH